MECETPKKSALRPSDSPLKLVYVGLKASGLLLILGHLPNFGVSRSISPACLGNSAISPPKL